MWLPRRKIPGRWAATFVNFSQIWGRSHPQRHLTTSTRGHSTSMLRQRDPQAQAYLTQSSAYYWALKTKYNAMQVKSCLILLWKKQIKKPKKVTTTTKKPRNLWKGVSIESWSRTMLLVFLGRPIHTKELQKANFCSSHNIPLGRGPKGNI